MNAPEILALIPARFDSGSAPDEHIRTLAGKPLLAHAIEQAKACSWISRCVVSTDSERCAAVARDYGALVAFLRPADTPGDRSTDLEVFRHALSWLRDSEGYAPDICAHLRPTAPSTDVADVSAMIEILLDDDELDSVRSLVPVTAPPRTMWRRNASGRISPAAELDAPETICMPPEIPLPVYRDSGSINVMRTRVITEQGSMTGKRIHGYIMQESDRVETARNIPGGKTATREPLGSEPKTFCFDIDGCIATIRRQHDYENAEPIQSTVENINALYEAGHQIVLFTARGSVSGIDWHITTEEQMKKWGVKHHELRIGKPAADYYVDDKMLAIEDLDDLVRDLKA